MKKLHKYKIKTHKHNEKINIDKMTTRKTLSLILYSEQTEQIQIIDVMVLAMETVRFFS